MSLFDQALDQYCIDHSSPMGDLLLELERETNLKTLAPQMMSGPIQGHLLMTICRMLKPKTIIELGTFTGYACLCMALSTSDDCKITTVEVNPELKAISQKYFKLASKEHKINSIQGKAEDFLKENHVRYDLAFIDAGKQNNRLYFDLLLPRMNIGGYILIDNTLWSGKVLYPTQDRLTGILKEFNTYISKLSGIRLHMLPIRDGLTIIEVL